MSAPGLFNFPDHYKGDNLKQIRIDITVLEGPAINTNWTSAKMQMKDIRGVLTWEFSTALEGNSKMTIDPATKSLVLPIIKSWNIKAGLYYYDLEVTDSDGLVTTYLTGTWKINQDISS